MMLVLAVASLVLGTGGVAYAKSTKAKAPIQKENAQCGNDTGGTVIGTASFKRTGNSVTVTYKLTGGLPTTEYTVELWEGKPPGVSCFPPFGTVAKFTTNKKGKGVGKGTIVVPEGATRFFATGNNTTNGFNDSLAVTLL
jgi:hypothetical protein